jgi:hypothetical protein
VAQIRKKWKAAAAGQPATAANKRGAQRLVLFIAALWLLVLAAYSNSFQAGLIYDSTPILLKDPRLHTVTGQNLGLILTKEYWYPPTGNGLYRPLTTLSYLFNYAVLGNGSQPVGYHVVNYLIHGANATLAFLLGLTLFGETAAAFAMAALWAVHPVLTESVTNVSGSAGGVRRACGAAVLRADGSVGSAGSMAGGSRAGFRHRGLFERERYRGAGRRGAVRFHLSPRKALAAEASALRCHCAAVPGVSRRAIPGTLRFAAHADSVHR